MKSFLFLYALVTLSLLFGASAPADAAEALPYLRQLDTYPAPYTDVDALNVEGLAHDGYHLWSMSDERNPGRLYQLTESRTIVSGRNLALGSAYAVIFDGRNLWLNNQDTQTLIEFRRDLRQTGRTIDYSGNGWIFTGDATWDGANIWIAGVKADQTNEIAVLGANGDALRAIPSPFDGLPNALAFDAATATLYATGITTDTLYRLDLNGTVLQTFSFGPFKNPDTTISGMAVSPLTGNLWVTAQGVPDRVYEFDLTPGPVSLVHDGTVSPLLGDAIQTYTWSLDIPNPNGVAINAAQVFINGQPQDLTQGAGDTWSFSEDATTLGLFDTNSYHFRVDAGGEMLTLPLEGGFAGPYLGDGPFWSFESGPDGWQADTAAGCVSAWALGDLNLDLQGNFKPLNTANGWTTAPGADYPSNAGDRLVGPAHTVRPNERLRFWMRYASEYAFDGLALELSVAGSAFFADPNLSYTPQTNTPLFNAGNCLITGAPGWSGPREGDRWQQHEVDLSPYAGQSVQVAFSFGSDGDIQGPGFAVDDVLMQPALNPAPNTPTPTPAPTRTALPSPTPTATLSLLSPTPTATPTPSPTVTPTPARQVPRSALAGLLGTDISSATGGDLVYYALIPPQETGTTLLLSLNGTVSDVAIPLIDQANGAYQLTVPGIGPGLPAGAAFEFGFSLVDGDGEIVSGPALVVRP